MDNVCNKTKLLLNYYITNSDKNYDIYCYPSEKMDQLNINNKVDLIMICPPYYNMEIYETYNENNNQSITLYTNYQSWLENYLTQTLLNCNELLNNNGIFAIIIGNYREYKTQIYYNLYEDIKNIFKNKFKQYTLLNEIKIYNRLSPLRNNDKTRYEYLLNYRKQI
jgi:DNA modification methylase